MIRNVGAALRGRPSEEHAEGLLYQFYRYIMEEIKRNLWHPIRHENIEFTRTLCIAI